MNSTTPPDIIDLGWDAPYWLRDYVQWCQEPDTESTQYLVWSCTDQYCSGIGDRVRGILTAFYLAVGTRRKFRIHSVKAVNLAESLQPAAVNWSSEAQILFESGPERIRLHGRNDSLQYAADTRHDRIASIFTTAMEFYSLYSAPEFADRFGDQDNINAGNWDVLATWAWAVLFRPTPALVEEIEAVKRDAGLDRPYIAVHVRHGGHWGDWLRHDSEEQLIQFINCTMNMTELIDDRDPLIYVASDDVDVKEQLKAALPNVRYDPEPPLHIEKTDDYRKQLRIWAEFMIIRDSSCIVASLSGFSLWPVMTTRDPKSMARCWARFDRCSKDEIRRSIQGPIPAYDAYSANDPEFGITAPPP